VKSTEKVLLTLVALLFFLALMLGCSKVLHGGETVNIEVTAEVVPPQIGPMLQKLSVNVLAPRDYRSSQGSGTIFLSDVYLDEDTETAMPAAFVITAHHVVAGLREVSTVIGSDGSELSSIRYRDAQVTQEQVENSRTVGEVKYDAKVISVDPRRDIALLRVRKGDFADLGASFYLGKSVPSAGTEIYHCGAPGGKEIGGTCSLTSGIISRIGVRIPGFGGGSELGIFDQTDTAALGGSSGGMIALRSNGEWIGMITLGLRAGDNFHWVVPQRSVLSWAKEVNIMWLFDKDLQRPTEDDIKAIVLENISPGYAGENKAAPTPAVPRCSSGELFVTPNVLKGDFNE
jgi:S1-C subfamily serine protease